MSLSNFLKFWTILFSVIFVLPLQAHVLHNTQGSSRWQEEGLAPFTELIFSWNAPRPRHGRYLFFVRVKTENGWSAWLPYASWGSQGQWSFAKGSRDGRVRVIEDLVKIPKGACGFAIHVAVRGDAKTSCLHALHVYTNCDVTATTEGDMPTAVHLPVAGLSQMALSSPCADRLCSPTSLTALVRFLSGKECIDPLVSAKRVWDRNFDTHGNWVFNVAEGWVQLQKPWCAWVERLSGFDALYRHLQQNIPVIVSIRGPLQGSALPYSEGHLVVVTGWDPLTRSVLCMDPAFATDEATLVSYPLQDFLEAWERRGRIAYLFS